MIAWAKSYLRGDDHDRSNDDRPCPVIKVWSEITPRDQNEARRRKQDETRNNVEHGGHDELWYASDAEKDQVN